MNILFNNDELLRLINNLYILTGIRANIYDFSGRDICLTDDHIPFCAKINGCPEGHERCLACDAQAVLHCDGEDSIYFYRCHAGICEAIIPIFSNGMPMAYLAFGQHLDTSSLEKQWENTRATLDWYPGDMEALKRDFFSFRQYSPEEITACAEDRHYMDKLSLASISSELGISRTKLCTLAKRLSGGKTLSQMIAERRVSAAKLLLTRTDKPIAVVAETVGITDYNYFTKIFRSVTGVTPSAFRKKYRHNDDILAK